MAKVKKIVKKLLSVPPKISQLKDIERVYSVDMSSNDFDRLIQYAIPELGKQISKMGIRNFSHTVEALGNLAEISNDYEELTNYYHSKNQLAKDLGFCESSWPRNGKCDAKDGFVDFDDLFERELEVEIVVHVRRPLKSKDKLAQYGIK